MLYRGKIFSAKVFPSGVGKVFPAKVFPAGVGKVFPAKVFGVRVWEGLSGGCRASFTLERCSRLAAFAIQPVSLEDCGTQEAGSTVANEILVVLYRSGTHQIRRRRREARSSTSQGSAEPLCARIKGANQEVCKGTAGV